MITLPQSMNFQLVVMEYSCMNDYMLHELGLEVT